MRRNELILFLFVVCLTFDVFDCLFYDCLLFVLSLRGSQILSALATCCGLSSSPGSFPGLAMGATVFCVSRFLASNMGNFRMTVFPGIFTKTNSKQKTSTNSKQQIKTKSIHCGA
jgi:fucose 4-O-acetylase-like acetyltransferase